MFKRKKPEQTPSEAPQADAAQLAGLVPFQGRDDRELARFAAASRLLEVPTGPWKPPVMPASVLFLLQGSIELISRDGKGLRLTHDSPKARLPLPDPEEYRIRAAIPSTLIEVPARFLSDEDEGYDCGFEMHEGDIEDQVYLDFYQALTAGKCDLPSMPDLAVRIGQVIDDPNTASEDIARVIQTDPALAARVMSVVNSAAHHTGQTIHSLSQAVSRLGRRNIRDLVFSFILKGVFRTDSIPLQTRMNALWSHSCEVAAIAAVLARYTPGLDPEHALLAGLIHDIGVVPVLNNARLYPELMTDIGLLDRVVSDLRGEVGALTLRQWGFGDDMIDIALNAEDWRHLGNAIPTYLDVVLLAQLHVHVGRPQMHGLPHIDSVPAFFKVADGQLTPRGSLAVIDQASAEIAQVQHMLEAA